MKHFTPQEKIMGIIRIALGWVFLWPFLDKLFGLGFTTEKASAWVNGGSPTYGFLSFGTKGPFAEIFQSLAGSAIVDWLFMLGLLGIGLALILGIFSRMAAYLGSLLFLLMWLAALPPEHNPFLDDHIVYSFMLIALTMTPSDYLGLGRSWKKIPLIQKYPFLQ